MAAPKSASPVPFRQRVEEALQRSVPWAAGLAPGREALLQLSGSASNFLYRVDVRTVDGTERRLCLRRAQHAEQNLHAVEAEVMRAARERGAVVPNVCGVLPLGDALGSGFFMDWVEGEGRGEKLVAAFASPSTGALLGRQIGETLARIQSVSGKALQAVPVGSDSPLKYLRSLRRTYDSFRVCRPALDYTFAWLEAHLPHTEAEEPRVLVHGDFRIANIMAHPQRGLSGVIDWEMAHMGNRYEDIGWICVRTWRYGALHKPVGGFAELADFCEGYELAGGARVDHATVAWWTLVGSVRWSILCLQQGGAFRSDAARFENGVVGRRTCEGELDCLITLADSEPGVLLSTGADTDVEPDSGFPTNAELVDGARRLLGGHVLQALTAAGDARSAFLVRVVNNALGMVARGLELGAAADRAEAASLARLLGRKGGDVLTLRKLLVAELQSGRLPLDAPGLLRHLLLTTGRQTLIDQPKYPSLEAVRSAL